MFYSNPTHRIPSVTPVTFVILYCTVYVHCICIYVNENSYITLRYDNLICTYIYNIYVLSRVTYKE